MVHFVAKEESFAHALEALAEGEIFGRRVLLIDNQPYTFGTLGKGPLAEGFDKGRAHTQASVDRKSTRLNSSHKSLSRMPSSA